MVSPFLFDRSVVLNARSYGIPQAAHARSMCGSRAGEAFV
jgi:hypothetical protein